MLSHSRAGLRQDRADKARRKEVLFLHIRSPLFCFCSLILVILAAAGLFKLESILGRCCQIPRSCVFCFSMMRSNFQQLWEPLQELVYFPSCSVLLRLVFSYRFSFIIWTLSVRFFLLWGECDWFLRTVNFWNLHFTQTLKVHAPTRNHPFPCSFFDAQLFSASDPVFISQNPADLNLGSSLKLTASLHLGSWAPRTGFFSLGKNHHFLGVLILPVSFIGKSENRYSQQAKAWCPWWFFNHGREGNAWYRSSSWLAKTKNLRVQRHATYCVAQIFQFKRTFSFKRIFFPKKNQRPMIPCWKTAPFLEDSSNRSLQKPQVPCVHGAGMAASGWHWMHWWAGWRCIICIHRTWNMDLWNHMCIQYSFVMTKKSWLSIYQYFCRNFRGQTKKGDRLNQSLDVIICKLTVDL